MGTETPERSSGLDVEDLNKPGDVGSGDEGAVGAEGGGGNDVGE